MTTELVPATEFRFIDLNLLDESPTNPRRHFEQAAMEELTASVKANGILIPLTVRPKADRFQIVVGARRFRAAQAVELETAPAIIREMTDLEVLKAQIIENKQRKDVHPLDEALSFQALMKEPGYDAKAVADEIGLSVRYVYVRLQLLTLIEPVKQALDGGAITVSHAELLAPLTPKDQAEALKACFEKKWTGHGNKEERFLISTRGLRTWIQTNCHLNLQTAPWPKDDAVLLPKAGPCTTCPKRSGNNPDLFECSDEEVCTDRACFNLKMRAFIEIQRAELESKHGTPAKLLAGKDSYTQAPKGAVPSHEWEPVKANACPHVVGGVILDGKERGQARTVCLEPGCKVHRPKEERRAAGEQAVQENRDLHEKQRAKEELKDAVYRNAGLLIGAKGLLRGEDLRLVALGLADAMIQQFDEPDYAAVGLAMDRLEPQLATLSDTDLSRLIARLAWLHLTAPYIGLNLKLEPIFKRHKIDLKAIEAQILEEQRKAAPATCTACGAAGVDLTKHVCSAAAIKKARKKSGKKAAKPAVNGKKKGKGK